MVTSSIHGSFEHVEAFLNRMLRFDQFAGLAKYGQIGADALAAATPVDDLDTSTAWTYEIVQRKGYYSIRWHNANAQGGIPIAVLIQYGHGTRNGGYVPGRDYINPAIRPIFDQIAADMWKVVTS